jgi:hypothetical protein
MTELPVKVNLMQIRHDYGLPVKVNLMQIRHDYELPVKVSLMQTKTYDNELSAKVNSS